jgi:hypothetical protein
MENLAPSLTVPLSAEDRADARQGTIPPSASLGAYQPPTSPHDTAFQRPERLGFEVAEQGVRLIGVGRRNRLLVRTHQAVHLPASEKPIQAPTVPAITAPGIPKSAAA